MIACDPAALAEFLPTWRVVRKEAVLPERSGARLFAVTIDLPWVAALAEEDARSERVEAFASLYSRLQDTLGDRLFPRLFALVGQHRGSLIDRLNQVERLGLLEDAQAWLAWPNLRKRLVHEYVENPQDFVDALLLAKGYATSLGGVVERIAGWLRGLGIYEQALA